MLKSLKIDYYSDGYTAMHSNCIDNPIAGAAGYYNYENYFYYCFYYSLLKNWTGSKRLNDISLRQKILDKLGLNFKLSNITNISELISAIRENIDKQCPIIMIVKYNTLFFLGSYLTDSKLNHAIVITDYNADKKIVVIRECLLNKEVTQNTMRGDPFFKLQLTEELISDIWLKSNDYFKEENYLCYNKLISIEKISEPKISSYTDLVEDFINNHCINGNNSSLLQIVSNFNENIDKIKDYNNIEFMRRDFHGSMTILFDIFEKSFEFLKKDRDKYMTFNEFKDKYIRYRYNLISILHANALRGKPFEDLEKKIIMDEIVSIDNEMFSLINNLYLYNKHKLSKYPCKNMVNYACKAGVDADSEHNPNSSLWYKASQAVNGKWNVPSTDMWISQNFSATHWLKIDLFKPRTIKKFVVRHHITSGYITVDFYIEGSHEGLEWEKLVEVKNNTDCITIHEIKPSTYRYFRLYITYPSQNDFYARIYEFEIWGISE